MHQRRVRTQMTQYQVNVMRLIFAEYKTPTMNECELMGKEINLKKRVVQVWFQNARAKEKKNHHNGSAAGQNPNRSILFSNTANNDLSNYEFSPDECLLCNVKYNVNSSSSSSSSATGGANSQQQRDHLFSKEHLNKLIQFVTNIAVENGTQPGELSNGKLFTGFSSSNSSSSSSSSSSFNKLNGDNEEYDDEMMNESNNELDYEDEDEEQEDTENQQNQDETDEDQKVDHDQLCAFGKSLNF
jgi:hypothetical protein